LARRRAVPLAAGFLNFGRSSLLTAGLAGVPRPSGTFDHGRGFVGFRVGVKFTRKMELAVAALLEQPTYKAAAEVVGVNEATLRQWMKAPEFRDRYRQAREVVLERVVARLLGLCETAAATLERNLGADKPAVQVRAALGILDRALRGVDTLDLTEELRQVKTQLEALKNAHGNPAPGSQQTTGSASGSNGHGGPSDADGHPGEPGEDDGAGGADARRLADGGAFVDFLTDTAALQ
jgi:hypothetical protein